MRWIIKFWNENHAWIKLIPASIFLVGLFIVPYWYFVGIEFNTIKIKTATDFRDFFIPIAAIVFIPFAIWRMTITHQQTDIQQQSVHTESYFKAIDNLARKDKDVVISAGAIYGLERIAQESEYHHLQIVELLCSYICKNATDAKSKKQDDENTTKAKPKKQDDKNFAIDIQAALDVLGRRSAEWIKKIESPRGFRMNLDGIYIKKANLVQLNLKGANLNNAHLEGAELRGACLERAELWYARLEGAKLIGARLERAELMWAHLEGAYLKKARLEHAKLNGAHLERAELIGTHLEGAKLYEAHLEGANFVGVDLSTAENLTQAQIDSAFGNKATRLPKGLTRPEHWPNRALEEWEGYSQWIQWNNDKKNYRPPE